MASEIVDMMFLAFFSGGRKKGRKMKGFLDLINAPFLCLFCTTIRHVLLSYLEYGKYDPKVTLGDDSTQRRYSPPQVVLILTFKGATNYWYKSGTPWVLR
jgi:hypothetical protein